MDLPKRTSSSAPVSHMTTSDINAMIDAYNETTMRAQEARQEQQHQQQTQQQQEKPKYPHLKHLIQQRYQMETSRASTSSGFTSESGGFGGATPIKQPIQPPQPTTSSTSSFARSATAAATVGAYQTPLNLKSNTSNPMSSSSTSSSSSLVRPGFRMTPLGPMPLISTALPPPKDMVASGFYKIGWYENKCIDTFDPSPTTSSTSSFARSATAAATVGSYQAPLNLKSNTSNPMPSSSTSSSSSAVQPGFRMTSAGPLPLKSIRPPPPKDPNARTAPYECIDTRDRPVNPVRQLPHDPSLKRTVDKSKCVQLTTPGAMTQDDLNAMLENTVVRSSKPTSVVIYDKAYPNEFKASGTQHFRISFQAFCKESYMTAYTNRPDPIRYPENEVQYFHSVYKDQDRIYEKKTSSYYKGKTLTCTSVFCIERVPLEEARRVQEERDREVDAAE